jgi:hypothetical protein
VTSVTPGVAHVTLLAASHRSNSVAAIRSSWTPAAASEASQTIGGPITAGSRNGWF